MRPRSGRTAVYQVRGKAGLLLYIGMTNGVGIRWNAHQLSQPWWDELRSLTVDWYGTRAEAAAAEKAAIKAQWPKYNKTYLARRAPRVRKAVAPTAPEPQPVLPEPVKSRQGGLLTPEEAAEFLAITKRDLRELSDLPYYDLDDTGAYIRYDPRDLRAYGKQASA